MHLGNTHIPIDLVSYHTIPHTAHMKVTLHEHHLPRLPPPLSRQDPAAISHRGFAQGTWVVGKQDI